MNFSKPTQTNQNQTSDDFYEEFDSFSEALKLVQTNQSAPNLVVPLTQGRLTHFWSVFNKYVQDNNPKWGFVQKRYKTPDDPIWALILVVDDYKVVCYDRTTKGAKDLCISEWFKSNNDQKTYAVPEMSEGQIIGADPNPRPAVSQLNAADGAITKTVDSSDRVLLVSQRDDSVTHVSGGIELPRNFQAFSEDANEFPKLCSRWNEVDQFEWSVDDPEGSIIKTYELPFDALNQLRTNPTMRPFENYAFYRPEQNMKFLPNSQPFMQGALVIGAKYLVKYDDDSEGSRYPRHADELLMFNHVIINASVANQGELDLPFAHFLDQIATLSHQATPNHILTVFVGVLSRLKMDASNLQSVSIATYHQFRSSKGDTKFYGQRTFAVPEADIGNVVTRVVNSVTEISNKVTSKLTWLPNGDNVTVSLSAVKDFKALNSDKPNLAEDPIPVYNQSGPSFCKGEGATLHSTLRLTPNALTPHHPSSVPQLDSEFTAAHYKNIFGLVDGFTWTTEDETGTILKCGPITPCMFDLRAPGDDSIVTPTGALATGFEYYTGDLEFKLMIFKTQYQSGRLALVTSPDIPPTSANYNDLPKQVWDVKENSECSFKLPYYAPTKIASLWGPNNTRAGYGWYAVIVLTKLRAAGTVVSNVEGVILGRAASNLIMSVPRDSLYLYPEIEPPLPPPSKIWQVDNGLQVGIYLIGKVDDAYNTILLPADDTVDVQPGNYVISIHPDITKDSNNSFLNDMGHDLHLVVSGKDHLLHDQDVLDVDNDNLFILIEENNFATPEMDEEREHVENTEQNLPNSQTASNIVHLGEHFDIKSLCRRFVRISGSRTNQQKGRFAIVLPVNLNTGVRTDSTPLPFQTMLHDSYRFYRGGVVYNLVLNTHAAINLRVTHVPHNWGEENQLRLITDPKEIDGIPQGSGLATEVFTTGTQSVYSVEVPYYSRANVLLNGMSTEDLNASDIAAFSNGYIVFDVYSIDDDYITGWDLWRAMANDGSYYLLQGTPRMYYPRDFTQFNETGSTSLRAIPEEPEPVENYEELETSSIVGEVGDAYRTVLSTVMNDKRPSMRNYRLAARKEWAKRYGSVATPEGPIGNLVEGIVSSEVGSVVAGLTTGILTGSPVAGVAIAKARSINQTVNNVEATTSRIRGFVEEISAFPGFLKDACSATFSSVSETVKNYLTSGHKAITTFMNLAIAYVSNEFHVKAMAIASLLLDFGIITISTIATAISKLGGIAMQVPGFLKGQINKVFATPEIDDVESSSIVGWLKFLLGSLVAAFGWSSGRNYADSFLRLIEKPLDVLNKFDTFLRWNLELIQTFIYWCVGKEHPDIESAKNIDEDREQITSIIRRVYTVVQRENAERVLTDRELQLDCEELYSELMEMYHKHKENRIGGVLMKAIEKMTVLRDTYAIRASKGVPKEPVCLWFGGTPGIGKTQVTARIAIDLAEQLGVVCKSNPIYQVTSGTRFWNGYSSEPIILYDDFGQNLSDNSLGDEITAFMRINSPAEFNPEQARLEEKDRVANPDIFMVTANNYWPSFDGKLACKEALWRRRDFLIYSTFSKSWLEKYPNCVNLKDPRITLEDALEANENLSHLAFYLLDPLHPQPTKKGSNGVSQFDFKNPTKHETYAEAVANGHDPRDVQLPMTYGELMTYLSKKSLHLQELRKRLAFSSARHASKLSPKSWESKGDSNDTTLMQLAKENLRRSQMSLSDIIKQTISSLFGSATPENPEEEEFKDTLAGPDVIPFSWADAQKLLHKENTCVFECMLATKTLRTDLACAHNTLKPTTGVNLEGYAYCREHGAFFNQETGVIIPDAVCDTVDCLYKTDGAIDTDKFFSFMRRWAPFQRKYALSKQLRFPEIDCVDEYSYKCVSQRWANIKAVSSAGVVDSAVAQVNAIPSLTDTIMSYLPTALRYVAAGLAFYCSFITLKWAWDTVLNWCSPDWDKNHSTFESWVTGKAIDGAVDAGVSVAKLGWSLAVAQLATSGDARTAKSSKQAARVLSRLAAPESQADTISKLKRNTCYFNLYRKTEDGKTRLITARGLGIVDRWVVVPYHYFKRPTFKCKVVVNGCGQIGACVDVEYQQLLSTLRRIEKSDLCVVQLPKNVPAFRKVTGLFPLNAELKYCPGDGVLMECAQSGDCTINLHHLKEVEAVTQPLSYAIDHDVLEHYFAGFRYDVHALGMCGSLLYSPKLDKFYGMHICASGKYGYAHVLTREMFDELALPVSVEDVVEPNLAPPQQAVLQPIGDFVPIGKVEDRMALSYPTKVTIKPSPLHGVLGEPSRFPVNPVTPGELRPCFAQMESGVEAQMNPHIPFKHDQVKIAVEDLKNEILAKCKPVTYPVVSKRPLQEAVFGLPGVDFMDSMHLSTSPGWPHCVNHKGKSKDYFLSYHNDPVTGHRVLDGLHPDIASALEDDWKNRVNGILPFSPYADFLKNERLKPGKSARLINGASMQETIAWRQVTLDFFASLKKTRLDIGMAVGMNHHGSETTELVQKLLAKGTKILTGDYSKFGPTLDADLLCALGEIVNAWYDKYVPNRPPEHVRAVEMLFEGLANCMHIAGDLCYKTVCGSPSGNPNTADINSLVNLLYLRLCWMETMADDKNKVSLTEFHKHLAYCVYGDDFIGCISDELADKFNNNSMQETFARHGIKFTDAAKTGEAHPYHPITEAQFLKMFFKEHETRPGMWEACLDKSVIVDIPSWIREPCLNKKEQVLGNMVEAIKFAKPWGREYYEEIVDLGNKACIQKGWHLPIPSWEQIDEMQYDMETPCWFSE